MVIQPWEQSMKLIHNITKLLCKLKWISTTKTFHLLDNNLKMMFTSIGGAVSNKQNILPCVRHDPCGRAVYRMGLRPLPWWDWGVRIPSGERMSVSWGCCMLSGRGVCDVPITRPEDLSNVVCLSVISKPQWWEDLGPKQFSNRGGGEGADSKYYRYSLRGKKMLQYDYK
jgi:hypothetical protein